MVGVRVSGHPNPANNGLFYAYTDHLGSVTALSDANSSYVAGSLGLHRPFGSYRVEPTTNPDITDRGFTGHKENLSLDLTYMNARYHLSEIGRFASPDPIVPDLMNPQTLNRYSYVNNNPINFRDSTGFYADEAGATGGGCDSRCIAILAAIAGSGYAAQQTIENLQDSLTDPFGMAQSNDDDINNEDIEEGVAQDTLKDLAGNVSGSPGDFDPDDFDFELDWNDPSKSPGEDWEWRGNGPPGSSQGNWFNKSTGESLHPDLNHSGSIGPHYDWKDPNGVWWRIFKDGTILKK